MSNVWIVHYDDHCPDPARYVAGVFASEAKAKAFVNARVEREVAAVPANYPEYLRRPLHYEVMYEIEQAELDPEDTDETEVS